MIGPFLALGFSVVTGWFLTARVPGKRHPDIAATIFHLSMALALGLSISSCVCFLALLLGRSSLPWLAGFDVAVLLMAAAICRWERRVGGPAFKEIAPSATERSERAPLAIRAAPVLILLAAVLIGLVYTCAYWLEHYRVAPQGTWDSWAIWNLKARFFFRDGGAHWDRAFSSLLDWAHPDYPLLLPLSIDRLWRYFGADATLVPAAFGLLIYLLTIALLGSALTLRRGPVLGLLAMLALLATPCFYDSFLQLADPLVALFLLAALASIDAGLSSDPPRPRLLLQAGLFAGAAAWTKCEGQMMCAVLALTIAGLSWWHGGLTAAWRQWRWFMLGLLPALALLGLQSLRFPAHNVLFTQQPSLGQTLLQIFRPERHRFLLKEFFLYPFHFAQPSILASLAALGLLLGLERDRAGRLARRIILLSLLLIMCGYYAVYLFLSRDLQWHVNSSLGRLFIQVWPGALFAFFLCLKAPQAFHADGRTGAKPQPDLGAQATPDQPRAAYPSV